MPSDPIDQSGLESESLEEMLPENVTASEVIEETTSLSESGYIPTTTEFPIQEPSIAAQPISGQQIEEVPADLPIEEAVEETLEEIADEAAEGIIEVDTEENSEENRMNIEVVEEEIEEEEEVEEIAVDLPISVKEEVKEEIKEEEVEKESEEDVYIEVTSYVDPSEYEAELPAPSEVNSESFMVPEYNPAMEAYAKKPKKEPKKRKKYKKRSFFRRIREKVTTYLRKLTLKDIRFMDDE